MSNEGLHPNPTSQVREKSKTYSLRQVWTLCAKNIQLYFKKGPVLIFGLMFPFFMVLTWVVGRDITPERLFIGVISMAAFFTSTAISPVILPLETREKGLERQITSPLTLNNILWGIILASTLFSLLISGIISVVLGIGASIQIPSLGLVAGFLAGLCLISITGSLIGVLISANPSDQTSDIMTIATLVKFPLLFISGVFVPLHLLPQGMQVVTFFSPLTYFVDALSASVGQPSVFDLLADLAILTGWILLLYGLTWFAHRRTFQQRFAQGTGTMQKMMMMGGKMG